jgi:hydrogenase nickel incorporation protein HypA/HybF
MHEMAIVQSIMDILDQQATIHDAKKVVSVSLEFGALTGVLPHAVEFAFEVLSQGGKAEGARLDITIIPIKAYCLGCEKMVTLQEYQPFCPVCSTGVLKIVAGRDEMRIASMEIE